MGQVGLKSGSLPGPAWAVDAANVSPPLGLEPDFLQVPLQQP